MRPLRPALSLPLLLLVPLAAGPALAEDDGAAVSRFLAYARTFPEPCVMNTFSLRGRVLRDGRADGTLMLRASAAERDGQAVWMVTERFESDDRVRRRTATATLDATLRPLLGTEKTRGPGGASSRVAWRAGGDGWRIERRERRDEGEVVSNAIAAQSGPVTATLTALCLFARFVLPEAGAFAVAVLDPERRADAPFDLVRFETGAEGSWQGRRAWVATGRRDGGETLAVHVDPETRDVLGIRITASSGAVTEIRAAAAEGIDFDRPARTPEEAALQAALALATADVAALARIVHWPSLHAAARARHAARHAGRASPPPFPDLEAYKAEVLAKAGETLERRPRALVLTALEGAREHLDFEDLEGGEVRVTLPAIFHNLVVVVKEANGGWYLGRMPKRPRTVTPPR